MARRHAIAIIGTSRETEPAVSNARSLGRLIAENLWMLVTGGRNAGVMRAANEGAKEVDGSLTIGILPDKETEISPAVDVAIVTGTGEARNNIIVLSADVVIACDINDPGTASEVALALKNQTPVILLNASAAAQGFFVDITDERIYIADSPKAAVELATRLLAN
jgi:uncharacterized protein (TIGR00725 family)